MDQRLDWFLRDTPEAERDCSDQIFHRIKIDAMRIYVLWPYSMFFIWEHSSFDVKSSSTLNWGTYAIQYMSVKQLTWVRFSGNLWLTWFYPWKTNRFSLSVSSLSLRSFLVRYQYRSAYKYHECWKAKGVLSLRELSTETTHVKDYDMGNMRHEWLRQMAMAQIIILRLKRHDHTQFRIL